MKTLKQYCIFNHPHEQPCQVDINDVREWLTQKLWENTWSNTAKMHNETINELIEELNQ